MASIYQQRFDTFLQTHQPKVCGNWQYYASGTGKEALLILHGGGSIAEAAFPYISVFEQDYTVIAPTLPNSLTTMQDALAGIQAILKQENISKAHVLGFSMGGMIAQRMMRAWPQMVGDVILFVSMAPSKQYASDYGRHGRGIAFFPAPLVNWLSKISLRKQIMSEKVHAQPEEKQFWADFFAWTFNSGRMNKQTLVSTSSVLVDYFNSTFAPDDLRNWKGRLLIFESDKDTVVDQSARDSLRALYPTAQMITLEGSGHFGVGLLQPETVIEQMKTFLRPTRR